MERAKAGWLEHIEWCGPAFDVPRDAIYVIGPGYRGSIVQVDKHVPGVFGLADDTLTEDQILVLFEGALLVPLSVNDPWRPLEMPDAEAVHASVSRAIAKLLESDVDLLRTDVNERTLTARLALHLQPEFAEWHVDCEYNRVTKPVSGKAEAKKLTMWCAYMEKFAMDHGFAEVLIFPDIIVHMRESCANLLVLEVKKHKAGDQEFFKKRASDIQKLNAIKTQLGYRFGAFISMVTGPKPCVEEILWVSSLDEKPGGPLCYVQYIEGEFLFMPSGSGPSRLGVRGE